MAEIEFVDLGASSAVSWPSIGARMVSASTPALATLVLPVVSPVSCVVRTRCSTVLEAIVAARNFT